MLKVMHFVEPGKTTRANNTSLSNCQIKVKTSIKEHMNKCNEELGTNQAKTDKYST